METTFREILGSEEVESKYHIALQGERYQIHQNKNTVSNSMIMNGITTILKYLRDPNG